MTNGKSAYRLGFYLSWYGLLMGVIYLGLIIAASVSGGLPPAEPYQSLISAVTFLSIPGLILLWVVVHQITPKEKQVFSLASLVLMTIFATLTSINRYTALTVVPQAMRMGKTDGLEWFLPYGWPSIMAAMEVLAWGFYYGLACLCLAPVFGNGKLERAIFWTLVASGVFSLISTIGQVLNSIPLNMAGILAWGPGFILLLVLWVFWFRNVSTGIKEW
jgi:hypothetical protein